MTAIRRVVVATLLAVWCFPALSLAKPAQRSPAATTAESISTIPAASAAPRASESRTLAAREAKARELQDFKGGRVYIAIGSSVLVIVLVVVLILLLV